MIKKLCVIIVCTFLIACLTGCGEQEDIFGSAHTIELSPISSMSTSSSSTSTEPPSEFPTSSVAKSEAPPPVESKPAILSSFNFSSYSISKPDFSKPNASSVGIKAEPAETSSCISDNFADEILSLVNAYRAEEGIAPLRLSDKMCLAAEKRADELTVSFSHKRPDGTQFHTALSEYGTVFLICTENIAAGYQSAKSVVDGWMNSEGHRENILSPNYNVIGIGHAYKSNDMYCNYWVQAFAKTI